MKTGTPALALLLVLGLAPALTAADSPPLDPDRVGWTEIRMTASKFFLSGESRLALRTVQGATTLPDLLVVADGQFTPLTPGNEVLELVFDTSGVGRTSRLTLLMDPLSGAAIQRVQHDVTGRQRQRTYRFGIEGAYQRTFWPASSAEKSLQPSRWTKTSEGLRAYPIAPGKQPVIEPTGLLYAVAAAPLAKEGDVMEVLVFRRRDTQTVRIEVLPARDVSVRYDELWPTGTVQRRGKVRPLRLSLRGMPTPGVAADDDDLELLGLRGRLELLLDPATRAPLQLSGDVKILGTVTLRLAELRPR